MPRELILVRHGESQHHVKGLAGGWTDTPLTNRGELQADAAGKALAPVCTRDRTWFLSSDLLRARSTAEIIARHIGLSPELHSELRELNNGAAKDKTREEAERIALPITEPRADWIPYPGAESWRAMTNRVVGFMSAQIERTAEESLLIVSHGNALVSIVHYWLGLEEKHWSSISYDFDCGSITRLGVNGWGERVISKLNDTSHLENVKILERGASLDAKAMEPFRRE